MVFGLQRYNNSSEQQKFLAIILNFFSLDESFSYFSLYYLYYLPIRMWYNVFFVHLRDK